MVAVAHNGRFNICRVGRCHGRFCHGEARADLPGEQGFQPLFFVLLCAVALNHFHIPGVRRRAVEDLARPTGLAHDFAQRSVLEIGQARAGRRVRQEQVPQALRPSNRLQIFNDGDDLPALAFGHLFVEQRLIRMDVLVHEFEQASAQVLHFGGIFEMHVGYCPLKFA